MSADQMSGKRTKRTWRTQIDSSLVRNEGRFGKIVLWCVPQTGDTKQASEFRILARIYALILTMGISELVIRSKVKKIVR
jgi:hypothetical protein